MSTIYEYIGEKIANQIDRCENPSTESPAFKHLGASDIPRLWDKFTKNHKITSYESFKKIRKLFAKEYNLCMADIKEVLEHWKKYKKG